MKRSLLIFALCICMILNAFAQHKEMASPSDSPLAYVTDKDVFVVSVSPQKVSQWMELPQWLKRPVVKKKTEQQGFYPLLQSWANGDAKCGLDFQSDWVFVSTQDSTMQVFIPIANVNSFKKAISKIHLKAIPIADKEKQFSRKYYYFKNTEMNNVADGLILCDKLLFFYRDFSAAGLKNAYRGFMMGEDEQLAMESMLPIVDMLEKRLQSPRAIETDANFQTFAAHTKGLDGFMRMKEYWEMAETALGLSLHDKEPIAMATDMEYHLEFTPEGAIGCARYVGEKDAVERLHQVIKPQTPIPADMLQFASPNAHCIGFINMPFYGDLLTDIFQKIREQYSDPDRPNSDSDFLSAIEEIGISPVFAFFTDENDKGVFVCKADHPEKVENALEIMNDEAQKEYDEAQKEMATLNEVAVEMVDVLVYEDTLHESEVIIEGIADEENTLLCEKLHADYDAKYSHTTHTSQLLHKYEKNGMTVLKVEQQIITHQNKCNARIEWNPETGDCQYYDRNIGSFVNEDDVYWEMVHDTTRYTKIVIAIKGNYLIASKSEDFLDNLNPAQAKETSALQTEALSHAGDLCFFKAEDLGNLFGFTEEEYLIPLSPKDQIRFDALHDMFNEKSSIVVEEEEDGITFRLSINPNGHNMLGRLLHILIDMDETIEYQ